MDMSTQTKNTKSHGIVSISLPKFIQSKLSNFKVEEEVIKPKPSQPHEALFFVLTYLNLLEFLKLSRVCKSFRDAINNDVLLWLNLVVESPLNLKITDDILLKFTSKAHGRLRSLVLVNCVRITDDGLQRVIEANPHIDKLHIPSCTQFTPEGVIGLVKRLKLKFLRLENIHNITKEHLETLYSCLKVSPEELKPNFYVDSKQSDSNPIDINLCPKCKDVKVVYDCPRKSCGSKNERSLTACKGCIQCVPRCEECGGCVEEDETGETACMDVVCLECWLRLLKCNLCNKPYCNRHVERIQWSYPKSSGFVCDACCMQMEQWLSSPC